MNALLCYCTCSCKALCIPIVIVSILLWRVIFKQTHANNYKMIVYGHEKYKFPDILISNNYIIHDWNYYKLHVHVYWQNISFNSMWSVVSIQVSSYGIYMYNNCIQNTTCMRMWWIKLLIRVHVPLVIIVTYVVQVSCIIPCRLPPSRPMMVWWCCWAMSVYSITGGAKWTSPMKRRG